MFQYLALWSVVFETLIVFDFIFVLFFALIKKWIIHVLYDIGSLHTGSNVL